MWEIYFKASKIDPQILPYSRRDFSILMERGKYRTDTRRQSTKTYQAVSVLPIYVVKI